MRYNGKNADKNSRLVSYRRPLASQNDADNVNSLIYLGANEYFFDGSPAYFRFPLYGFAMPGVFAADVSVMDNFPQ